MRLAFDEVKATQTAAMFLRLARSTLNYMALIKLLYRADREALRRLGLPITTDNYASLKFGPITSTIYDRIKASANTSTHPTFWSAHIQHSADPKHLRLHSDPGTSELSVAEEKIIREVFAADGHKDPFDLADQCHEEFPEWVDPGKSSVPIEISDILTALNLSEDESEHIQSLIAAQISSRQLAT